MTAQLQANLADFLTPHHTEARIYPRYDMALDAAMCMGICAQPQRCLAKDGWTVVVVWDNGQYYRRA